MKNYKGFLIDIDNTLYDYESVHKKAETCVVDYISNKFDFSVDVIKKSISNAKNKVKIDLDGTASSHNRLLYYQIMFEDLKIQSLSEVYVCYNLYWDIFIDSIELFDGVIDFLEMISNKQNCFVTDLTGDIQYRKIIKLGLEKYVKFIVTSEEAGVEKPHPYMFIKALRKLNLNTSEVCFIGDNFHKDIVGSYNLGIHSLFINKQNQIHSYEKEFVDEFTEYSQLIRKFYE